MGTRPIEANPVKAADAKAGEGRPSGKTTKLFWPLMDRWGIPDAKALKLLGHAGGLTSNGKRPRFTLTDLEVSRLTHLKQIDVNLDVVFGGGEWLLSRTPALPFAGLSPLDYMIERGPAGINETLRFLNRWAPRHPTGH